jgi:hypothetical protein
MQGSISQRTGADAGNIHERVNLSAPVQALSNATLHGRFVAHIANRVSGVQFIGERAALVFAYSKNEYGVFRGPQACHCCRNSG